MKTVIETNGFGKNKTAFISISLNYGINRGNNIRSPH